jgi:putative tricarboxylic transport membrane protein
MRSAKTSLFVWLGISLFFIIESLRLGLGNVHAPGPGFLPFGVAVLVGIFTVVELLKKSPEPDSAAETKPVQWSGLRKMLYVLIFIFAFPFLLDKIGFFLCTLLFSGACLRVVGGKSWVVTFGLAIVITIFTYLVFVSWLQLIFPEALWITKLLSMIKG